MFEFGEYWQTILTVVILSLSYAIYRFIVNQRYVTDITNKCVFITGCDSGFGRGLASRLDALGCPVFAGCLTEKATKELMDQSSDKMRTIQLDVTSSESVQMALQIVQNHLQKKDQVLWGVVNNAGILGKGGPIEFTTKSDHEKVMQVNFLSQIDIITKFLPLLKSSKGRIVNVSSIAGKSATPNSTVYTASKYAVLGYTEALRREKKIWGIGVSTIMPGVFKTNILAMIPEKLEKEWADLPQAMKEEYGQEYQVARIKHMQDVMNMIAKPDITPVLHSMEHALFSVSPQATYLVGMDAKIIAFLEWLPFGIMDKFHGITPKALVPKVLKN